MRALRVALSGVGVARKAVDNGVVVAWLQEVRRLGGVHQLPGEDSQTTAALIDRELTARFGRDQVFLDCRSIPAGADFADELLSRLQACSVLLVVIGPRWLMVTDEAGGRRIDDPRDWIRREIAAALAGGLRVPVLIDDGRLPSEAELPNDIAGLAGRQYVPLRRRYTQVDLAYLVEWIVETDSELAATVTQHEMSAMPAPSEAGNLETSGIRISRLRREGADRAEFG